MQRTREVLDFGHHGQIARHQIDSPAALIAFDILVDGSDSLATEPWRERRTHLAALLQPPGRSNALRLSDVADDGEAMLREAHRHGWEGIIAKRADSPYEPGRRSRAWLKLKIEQRQEFVVGGFTEPRNAREHMGAILLAFYDANAHLIYAGHTGTGFTRTSLRDLFRRLARLERKTSPFSTTPRTNERAHWVRPTIVVEVKFNGVQRSTRLPSGVALRFARITRIREDKRPEEVEPLSRMRSLLPEQG